MNDEIEQCEVCYGDECICHKPATGVAMEEAGPPPDGPSGDPGQ